MVIKELNLVNYRNISNIKLFPTQKYNVLYGDNGQGKTNIIESIYLLGYLKSFRQSRNLDYIGNTGNQCSITSNFYVDDIFYKYNLLINNKNKIVKINNKLPETSHYLNFVKSVIYSTDELSLFRGSNLLRKNFIDRGIFLVDINYLYLVKKYNFILKSRNSVLKKVKKKTAELDSWSELLVDIGSQIRKIRFEYIKKLNNTFIQLYNLLFKEKDKASIVYKIFDDPIDKIKENFYISLTNKLSQELSYGQTLSGPHLDKVDFIIGDKNLKYYGSQGQLRTILLSIKLAQLYDYKEKFDKFPILLLDDICSELDLRKLCSLFDYISGNIGQIFITTTSKDNLKFLHKNDSLFYRVNSGEIILG